MPRASLLLTVLLAACAQDVCAQPSPTADGGALDGSGPCICTGDTATMRHLWIGSGNTDPASAPNAVGDLYVNLTTRVVFRAIWTSTGPAWAPDWSVGVDRGTYVYGPRTTFAFNFAAGFAAGTPDDVQLLGPASVYGPMPGDLVVVAASAVIQTAVAATTMQLRDAAGGAGNALSGPVSTAATGAVRESVGGGFLTPGRVLRSGAIFLRRSDQAVAGTVYLDALPLI